jgi:hypothetical protein
MKDTVEKWKPETYYCLNIQMEFNFFFIDLHVVCRYFLKILFTRPSYCLTIRSGKIMTGPVYLIAMSDRMSGKVLRTLTNTGGGGGM